MTTAPLTVTRLATTPIKGLGIVAQDEVRLTPSGARGDRRFFLATAEDALLSVTRTGAWLGFTAAHREDDDVLRVTCPDGSVVEGRVRLGAVVRADFYGYKEVAGREVLGPWSRLFSDVVGRPVRLVRAEDTNGGIDVRPVSLLGDASVEELARHAAVDVVDSRRFRMLIGFSGAAPHAEDTWAGTLLRLGEAQLRVEGPVKRCGAVLRHPGRGDNDLRTLGIIKDYRGMSDTILGRGVSFGVYAAVVRPGVVRVGDRIEMGRDS